MVGSPHCVPGAIGEKTKKQTGEIRVGLVFSHYNVPDKDNPVGIPP